MLGQLGEARLNQPALYIIKKGSHHWHPFLYSVRSFAEDAFSTICALLFTGFSFVASYGLRIRIDLDHI